MSDDRFAQVFEALTGKGPFPWQKALYAEFCSGRFRSAATLPTGLGKTSVIAVWLVALSNRPDLVPRRLVYVVNRRTVVDQSTAFTERLRTRLLNDPRLTNLRERLSNLHLSADGEGGFPLAISTLRGQFADNGEWSKDPARPAVVVGTVDLIGSRLLFSGYRAGFKTKPLFAGFLGQDVLLVHDEAHLEPAFQSLLESIQAEQRGRPDFRPLHVLALTATARTAKGQDVFKLTDQDFKNKVVAKRLGAKKQLRTHPVADEQKVVPKLVELALAHKDSGQAVLVFVRTVEGLQEVLKGLAKGKVPEKNMTALTGTIRGLERDRMAAENPVFARFLPEPAEGEKRSVEPAEGTVYLVCTAAGEVGVDASADHLVCDLTPFDSMAQRFGRVNRYGDGDAHIDVVHEARPNEKKQDDPYDQRRWRALALLTALEGDASPAALTALLPDQVTDAFSPAPEILPVGDVLFDAWAMTTVRESLPGRPRVAEWLHGVAEWQPPDTYVAWRQEVWELRQPLDSEEDRQAFGQTVEELLEDYPLKPHELLRDTTARVFKQLSGFAAPAETPVWVVAEDGSVRATTLGELTEGNDPKQAQAALAEKTVLLPPQAGGLVIDSAGRSGGVLTASAAYRPEHHAVYDVADEWFEDRDRTRRRRQRVWDDGANRPAAPSGMRLVRTIELGKTDEEDEGDGSAAPRTWRWYVRPWSADDDGSRSAREPQDLGMHLAAAERFAGQLATKLGLPPSLIEAVTLAARWHDRGKDRALWQRSIGNAGYPGRVLAKSGGSMRATELSHYRHEFGSLMEADAALRDHPERDLILHLIAAHHGRGRLHFPADEAFDPDHADAHCADMAREVPQRFARLQRRFGRWGLAYLESLLRAADALASDAERVELLKDLKPSEADKPHATPKGPPRETNDPAATVRVAVDPANPGQFFACCGLLELADRLWPEGAEAWFSGREFLVRRLGGGKASLAELIGAIGNVELRQCDPDDDMASPVELGAPFGLRLDWWQETDARGRANPLKVWAGSMRSVRIARAMQRTLTRPELQTERLFEHAMVVYDPDEPDKKVEPFYFDARRGANAQPVDIGFSPDPLQITVAAYPAVEFLCLVGLQRCRPRPTDRPRVFDYFTWSCPLEVSVVAAAVCGLLPGVGARGYRFENGFRTDQKKHKSFLPATPLGGDA